MVNEWISLRAVLGEAGILYNLDRELSKYGVTNQEIKRLQILIAQEITQLLIKHGQTVIEDFKV